jgi:sugar lactone lactonase YvrE
MNLFRELTRSVRKSAIFAAAATMVFVSSSRADVIYVSNWGNNTVWKFTAEGSGSIFANTGLNHPMGLAFDEAGNLYVANSAGYKDSTIRKFAADGTGSQFATNLYASMGVAIKGTDIYVANEGSTIINKISSGGSSSVFKTTGYSTEGLAFDRAGNLYVADFNDNRVMKYTPGSASSIFANTGLNGPTGIAFDREGNLYVANTSDNSIRKFSPAGIDLGTFASTGLSYPQGVAFDSEGNLYVANFTGGNIRKFSPTGSDLGNFVNSGLVNPTYLAIARDPSLKMLISSNQAILSWPVSGTNYVLQSTTDLSSPNWINSSTLPVVQVLQCVLTNSVNGAKCFYRLRNR